MDDIKKLLLLLYRKPDILDTINDIACKHCPRRESCLATDDGCCTQTDEEAIDVFVQYGLKELMEGDKS